MSRVRFDYSIQRQRQRHEQFVGRMGLLARLDELLVDGETDRRVVITGGPALTAAVGPFDDESPRGRVLQDPDRRAQVVTAEAVGDTCGAVGSPVRLVVLSAGYSDQQVEVLLAHVDAIVGMHGPIGDDAARNFAIGFYGGLRPVLRVCGGVDASTLILGFPRFGDAGTREHAGAPAEPHRRVSPVMQIYHLEVHGGGTGVQLDNERCSTSGRTLRHADERGEVFLLLGNSPSIAVPTQSAEREHENVIDWWTVGATGRSTDGEAQRSAGRQRMIGSST